VVAGRDLPSCRLVQFSGDACTGRIDVPPDEIESEITGAICEGLGVDWNEHEGALYLVLWEPESLPWTWRDVFAEQGPAR
jgi:hypothetical protein